MSLTPAELAAARAFRAARRADLDRKTADITASVFVRYERHDCAGRGGKSVFLELKEHYAWSPEYEAVDLGTPERAAWVIYTAGAVPWDELAGRYPVDQVAVPARRFAWIWTEGRCPACGMTALSRTGRLVDPETRPPAAHAVICGG